jgi:hypothetical protein
MRVDVVVLPEPPVRDDLGLLCCAEPFSVEHLATKGSVEAFVVSVLPR